MPRGIFREACFFCFGRMYDVVVMSDYIIDLNTYKINEEYRPSWDNMIIHAIQEPSANLQQFAVPFVGEGEYKKFQTDGNAQIFRRTGRKQILGEAPEISFGERYIYPSMYYSQIGMSLDDLVLKGDLPVSFEMLDKKLREAIPPVMDKAFYGVTYSSTLSNCYIPATTSKSPYAATDALCADQGLLGTAYVLRGELATRTATGIKLHQQPCLGYGPDKAAATSYADYDTASELQLNMKETSVIPVNWVESGATPVDSGMTLEKLMTVKHAFMARNVISDMNHVLNCAITMRQFDDLAHDAKLQNIDFGYQLIKNGVPLEIYGVRLIISEHVPIVNIGSSGAPKWVRSCPVWIDDAVGFGTWDATKMYFEKVPNTIDYYRHVLSFGIGCGRLRDEAVVCIHCAERPLARLDAANIQSA